MRRIKLLSLFLALSFILMMWNVNGTTNAGSITDDQVQLLNDYQQTDESGINDFINRLYSLSLGRTPDAYGLGAWTRILTEQKGTGISVAYGFIYSNEFQSRDISNEEYIELMYQMFFGRAADPSGKLAWVNVLNTSDRREGRLNVFSGFANSDEFYSLCRSYGITAGTFIEGKDVDQVAKVNLFVQRLYSVVLGRNCDRSGMENWTNALLSEVNTGTEAAQGFFFSSEYLNSFKNNEEYVNDLYSAFMGRTADSAGRNSWVIVLRNGASRENVFNGFSQSSEFRAICESYGINPGGPITEPSVTLSPSTQSTESNTPSATPTVSPTATPTPTPSIGSTTPVTNTPTPTPTQTSPVVIGNGSTLVWIPRTGHCYHNDPTCSRMRNPSQVTLEEAVARGYDQCRVCYG